MYELVLIVVKSDPAMKDAQGDTAARLRNNREMSLG